MVFIGFKSLLLFTFFSPGKKCDFFLPPYPKKKKIILYESAFSSPLVQFTVLMQFYFHSSGFPSLILSTNSYCFCCFVLSCFPSITISSSSPPFLSQVSPIAFHLFVQNILIQLSLFFSPQALWSHYTYFGFQLPQE